MTGNAQAHGISRADTQAHGISRGNTQAHDTLNYPFTDINDILI